MTETETLTFLVTKTGVGIKVRGLSAHGFGGAASVVIFNGERNKKRLRAFRGLRNRFAPEFQIGFEKGTQL